MPDCIRYYAARSAFWLALVLLTSGETAVGGGWVGRAQRLLADVDGDVVERGYLLIHVMYRHIFAGDYPTALTLAQQVTDYGRRFTDPDLIAMGLSAQGRLLLYHGRVPEGLALLDEAMVGVAADEVSTIFASNVYCTMIEGCQEICDFDRAAQWTTALTAWCDQQPGLVPFTGQCAVHRGQIMRVQGAFDEALTEFELSARRYRDAGTPAPAGLAMTERGDILRLRSLFDRPGEEHAPDVWMSHADATSSVMLQVPGLGAFVRCLLPVQLTGGFTVTVGVWLGVHPDDLQRAARLWDAPEYRTLMLDSRLANALPRWGLLAAPARATVRDETETPYVTESPDPVLAEVLTIRWPHDDVLDALPA